MFGVSKIESLQSTANYCLMMSSVVSTQYTMQYGTTWKTTSGITTHTPRAYAYNVGRAVKILIQ